MDTCPQCHLPVPQESYFCPNCGKQLRERPLSTTFLMQAGIYFLSIFLPPLGLWPGVKYFRHSDPRAKQIGTVAIVLTVASSFFSIWLTFQFLNVYVGAINGSLYGIQ